MKKLVCRHTDRAGNATYYLLRYDGGNFFVRSADTPGKLETGRLTGNSRISGRWGQQIWSCWEDGFLRITDISRPPAETNLSSHFKEIVQRADGGSRLARAILYLGVEGSFWSSNVASGNAFSVVGKLGQMAGTVEFQPSAGPSVPYKVNMKLTPHGSTRSSDFEILGTVSTKKWLPEHYELFALSADKQAQQTRVRVARMEVLSVTLAKQALGAAAFLPEKNFVSGFHSLVVLTNNQLLAQTAPESRWRSVGIFGWQITSRSLRMATLFILVIVTVIFVAVGRRGTQQTTNNKQIT